MKLSSTFMREWSCQTLIPQKVLKFRINKICKLERYEGNVQRKVIFKKCWKFICINIENTKTWQQNNFVVVVHLIFSNHPKCSNVYYSSHCRFKIFRILRACFVDILKFRNCIYILCIIVLNKMFFIHLFSYLFYYQVY